jgi:hypothetical protein
MPAGLCQSQDRGKRVIRGKFMLRGGSERRPPAHAGRLTRWERVAFAVIFLLMIAYIVAVTILALRAHDGGPPHGSAGGGQPAAARADRDRGGAAAGRPGAGLENWA